MTQETASLTLLQTLEHMAETADEDGYSLREVMDRLDEGAFGALLFILALPCAIPLLWGVPQIVAVPMIALAAQMAWGRKEPWLPAKIAARQIDKDGLTRTAKGGRKWVGWVEKIAKPRLSFLTGKAPERIIGLFLLVFCASILIPLPGTNSVPALGVAIAAFGLVQRDGLLVILGLIIGTAWICLLVFGGLELLKYGLGLIGIGSGSDADAAEAAQILLHRQLI